MTLYLKTLICAYFVSFSFSLFAGGACETSIVESFVDEYLDLRRDIVDVHVKLGLEKNNKTKMRLIKRIQAKRAMFKRATTDLKTVQKDCPNISETIDKIFKQNPYNDFRQ